MLKVVKSQVMHKFYTEAAIEAYIASAAWIFNDKRAEREMQFRACLQDVDQAR